MSKLADALRAAPPLTTTRPGVLDGLDEEDRAEIIRLRQELHYSAKRITALLRENGVNVADTTLRDWMGKQKAWDYQ